MGTLIDTSIFIESERQRLDLQSFTDKRPGEEFFMSVITVSELMHGVYRARDEVIRRKRAAITEGVVARFTILNIDLPTSRRHAELWASLEMVGQSIGPHDLWLAASCLANGLKLVTANEREFRRVPGLEVENWSKSE